MSFRLLSVSVTDSGLYSIFLSGALTKLSAISLFEKDESIGIPKLVVDMSWVAIINEQAAIPIIPIALPAIQNSAL